MSDRSSIAGAPMPRTDATDVIPRVLVEIVENALFFDAAAEDDVAMDARFAGVP
jgi:hypothetical protein